MKIKSVGYVMARSVKDARELVVDTDFLIKTPAEARKLLEKLLDDGNVQAYGERHVYQVYISAERLD